MREGLLVARQLADLRQEAAVAVPLAQLSDHLLQRGDHGVLVSANHGKRRRQFPVNRRCTPLPFPFDLCRLGGGGQFLRQRRADARGLSRSSWSSKAAMRC